MSLLRMSTIALIALTACSPEQKVGNMMRASSVASSPAPGNMLSCENPVRNGDNAKLLLARFGNDAAIADVTGSEGAAEKGVILFGSDPQRRVEVLFSDDALVQVSSVIVRGDANIWVGPRGLYLGNTIADVQGANVKPFILDGFERDYGGYVVDFMGGRLDQVGNCKVSIRLGLPERTGTIPEAIRGNRQLLSTDPAVREAGPVVEEMSVSWPVPPLPARIKGSSSR